MRLSKIPLAVHYLEIKSPSKKPSSRQKCKEAFNTCIFTVLFSEGQAFKYALNDLLIISKSISYDKSALNHGDKLVLRSQSKQSPFRLLLSLMVYGLGVFFQVNLV